MKIYTKTGDEGLTSLFGGARLSKDDIRIEAYGTVDELNAFTGNLYDKVSIESVNEVLFIIQNKLFNIGSVLASDPEKKFNLPGVNESDVKFLENQIDMMEKDLEPLKNFILPSGHEVVSSTHICRTVCRRAERRIVALNKNAEVETTIIVYLNRLSDYYFVLARYLTVKYNASEIIWKNV